MVAQPVAAPSPGGARRVLIVGGSPESDRIRHALEAAGDAMAALPLYMRVGKLSAEVARVFRLV